MAPLVFDLGVIGLVVIQAIAGIRRGFVIGILDLLCWGLSLGLTLVFVGPLASLLAGLTSLPQGLAGLASAMGLLFVLLALFALAENVIYRAVIGPHLGRFAIHVDRALGALTGALNGIIVAGLLLEFVLLVPVNTALNDAIMGSRLARPLALVALTAGQPFVDLAQKAALDVNGILIRQFGEAPIRLSIPVTDLSVDSASEQHMLALVNAERAQRGLQQLSVGGKLTQIARQHSTEMLQMHYFAHDSPTLGSPFDRMARAGIGFRVAGENIALAPDVERAHTGLMNSPEHRDNILRPEFRKIGIGVVNGGLSGEMFTQDFTD